ncbi:MAG: Asp-tRNA(Asn)/Glu-tRNA(Gln) amidotransferase subunit GatB, partial [Candidatus Geothermincolia bacterium]
MAYETVIGLEIHVELKTASKMFCGCDARFGGEPNTKTCPVCLGLPGVLPVINRRAVELTVLTGLALECGIASHSIFHRKNYFYPDMPKDFQISQYDLPLAVGGRLDVDVDGVSRSIGITRVHLEEDTGKTVHIGESGRIHGADYSLVDFNRAGVPLMEIVTEPDMRDPAEARAFMQELKTILEHLGVSDVKMEEGSLRCDANVSLRRHGAAEFGTKVEIKNMNSFRALYRALNYEVARQTAALEAGEELVQETRHWDGAAGKTHPLRTKEYAFDYRYFPEPDLVSLEVAPWVEELGSSMPELPAQRRARFLDAYGLPDDDVAVLTSEKALGDYYEAAAAGGADPKLVANWVMGELLAYLNAKGLDLRDLSLTPEALAEMIAMQEQGIISSKLAKQVFAEMLSGGKTARQVVEELGLTQISDEGELRRMVEEVLAANPEAVKDFRDGKERAVGFLVGQVM